MHWVGIALIIFITNGCDQKPLKVSDKEYQPEKKLSNADHDLANARGDSVTSFIRNSFEPIAIKIEIFTMTEGAHWFEKTLKLDEAKLKNLFSSPKDYQPVNEKSFDFLRHNGGPG